MSSQGIPHKNLTDPQLHELKGASTATLYQLPFANGNGGTEWSAMTFNKMSIDSAAGGIKTVPTITAPIILDDAGMGAITTGVLTDAVAFVQVNKNCKELAEAYNKLVAAYTALKADHDALIAQYNQIATALINARIITGDV